MSELSDLTAQCIRCGFCLESCPTFVVSGNEAESPRGRIYLARSMDEGLMPWTAENRAPIDTCVGCRACETACPSGVHYGRILELTRSRFVEDPEVLSATKRKGEWATKLVLAIVSKPRLFAAFVGLGRLGPSRRMPKVLNRLLSAEPGEADLPSAGTIEWPDLDATTLPAVKGEVALLEGCAMGVLYPDVHAATERLLRRVGYETVRVRGCCGALHAHAGYLRRAGDLSSRIARDLCPGATLVTDSAGCGSWLKEALPNARVQDVTEFLLESGLADALRLSPGLRGTRATYHQACHLVHGQKVVDAPARLLGAVPGLKLVPLEESDMCCGSGGVYNVLQPARARKLLDRKWRNVDRTGAPVVVTGNPGCQSWMSQASRENGGIVQVFHTVTILESAFLGSLP